MGKSTAAKMFADAGCDVWDADAAVHRLYAPGGAAVAPLAALHPEAVVDGAVSRPALKAWIDADPSALARIEQVVHPLVAADRDDFAARSTAPVTVFDIPLLFENGTEAQMDAVAVVSAPAQVQRDRVLARGTMTEAQFESILAKQMPDADKRARADYIIRSTSFAQTQADVDRILQEIGQSHA
ncbi:dephospho-CoA kinase [Meridianimarinicoccus marinus]